MAGACDVQLDGSAEDVFVTSGSIVTLTGQVQNLSVSQSAQINLSGNAEAGSAVFENGREGMPDDECVCIAGKVFRSNPGALQKFEMVSAKRWWYDVIRFLSFCLVPCSGRS